MPLRLVKPWLLLDWIYKLTETASAELDQKQKLDIFTRKVNDHNFPILTLHICSSSVRIDDCHASWST